MSSIQGIRPTMEDRHTVATYENLEFFGIFDGHGGEDVADFVSNELAKHLLPVFAAREKKGSTIAELGQTVRQVYRDLDKSMFEQKFEAGSCALVAIFDRVSLDMFVINLGDSRAFLFTEECRQLLETFEKSPADPDERQRIENSEHVVLKPCSVDRIDGHLAVSRAFGDIDLKTPKLDSNQYTQSKGAVSAVPIFHHINLKPNKRYFLILACDGFWTDGGITNPFTETELMHMIARRGLHAVDLTNEALRRGSGDNITTMLICFNL